MLRQVTQPSVASTSLHLRHMTVSQGYGNCKVFPSSSTFALGAIDWAAEASGGIYMAMAGQQSLLVLHLAGIRELNPQVGTKSR
jgi:hypothetical protein